MSGMQVSLQGVQRRPPVAPPLKWAGGKRWLLPVLDRLWANHEERRLVEPFMGGLAVSLGLGPQRAVLNDSNPHLVNLYRQLRDGLEVSIEFRNDEATYYAYRERFNDLVKSDRAMTPEAAQLFYYLNRTGFNGLCRFNAKGLFNVPMGRYANIDYEDTESFKRYRSALAGWDFVEPGDFESVPAQRGDFVYADPPYDDAFTGYDKGGFNWHDQERLAYTLSRHDGPVVASNHATPRVVALYRELGFTVHVLDAPRRISCTGDRTAVPEMLATRNLQCRPSRTQETCSHCGLTQPGSSA